MKRTIAISSIINQIFVGVVEDGRLAEFYIERENQQRTVGNIYKGRVENVLPGMSAAFVNIGLERNAFLYVDDVVPRKDDQSIEDLLRRGQELLVQIVKEPVGTKGARITTQLSIPGRFLVLMPGENHIGISRQIQDVDERERLRKITHALCPRGHGLIVRTVAEACTPEEVEEDLQALISQWRQLRAKASRTKAPALIYKDHDLVYRIIRDLVTDEVSEVLVDQTELWQQAKDMVDSLGLDHPPAVRYYDMPLPLFEELGLTRQLERASKRRVWLDCGGYLVFDYTEALVSIDVNTGKYVGKASLEATVLQTNLQAADEIAKQLRLRNLGGIIVIDFIDMEQDSDRAQVIQRMEDALSGDKVRTHVLGFTKLGLVELSRRKSKKSLAALLESPCPHCLGLGRVKSEESLALRAAQEVYSVAREPEVEAVLIQCNPNVASFLIGNGGANLEALEKDTGVAVYVRGDEALERDDFQIRSGSKEAVAKRAAPVMEGDRLEVEIERAHSKNPRHGIARVEGFVLDVPGAGHYIGSVVDVVVTDVRRTYAVAEMQNRN